MYSIGFCVLFFGFEKYRKFMRKYNSSKIISVLRVLAEEILLPYKGRSYRIMN